MEEAGTDMTDMIGTGGAPALTVDVGEALHLTGAEVPVLTAAEGVFRPIST